MRELNLYLTLSESPPISALVIGMNPSPDGESDLVYVDGYFPGLGQINEHGYNNGPETVLYRKLNPKTKAMEIVDFREPHHIDAFRQLLETSAQAPSPRRVLNIA